MESNLNQCVRFSCPHIFLRSMNLSPGMYRNPCFLGDVRGARSGGPSKAPRAQVPPRRRGERCGRGGERVISAARLTGGSGCGSVSSSRPSRAGSNRGGVGVGGPVSGGRAEAPRRKVGGCDATEGCRRERRAPKKFEFPCKVFMVFVCSYFVLAAAPCGWLARVANVLTRVVVLSQAGRRNIGRGFRR